ncbi:Dipeptidyl peptidase IV [Candidatus Sulfotelmatobacter kueseliae]|uniref:Dipeptidyl peptidase IV n=1 Tax=Candidatus Sulfotelmatobacter kueseliae TaxID=2042962 RepID=A0A2U3KWZ2_9BACT|nr:Dipeptidyl peptidase IV [Candidatus Sulfotelmatobacter kueseliae]
MHIIECARIRKSRGLRLRIFSWLAVVGFAPAVAYAQSPALVDLLHREFVTKDFAVKSFGPARWLNGGTSYTTLEPSAKAEGARDIVRYDTATAAREVLVAASQLTPPGSDKPLAIEGYDWSADMKRVLIFTNSRRVWRENTRGDYWVLDRKSGTLRKLGAGGPLSSLMFAKFSPDGSNVAYVRFNNIFVEDIESGVATRLTNDGSEKIVNGTSDWVYEEEFSVRDGFRWSPDGQRIAYWQFDTSNVKNFALAYDTGPPSRIETGIPYPQLGVYPTVRQIPYPLPGTQNSSVRVGVVPAIGGETRWMQVPGYPNDNYIARMEWAGDSGTLVLEHLNRLQNTNDVLLADVKTGVVHAVYQDRDAAWVDVVDDLKWVHGGADFVWLCEQDGWRHVYLISRDGKQVRPVTPGAFDVISVVGIDPAEEWLYYLASPENATQRYLYRTRIDGKGKPERLSPANQPGTHSYEVSPDLRWAIHTYSSFDTPPVTDLVRLPDHATQRILEDNAKLGSNLKELVAAPTEFLHVDIGEGVVLDGWLMKPPNFDPAKKYPILVYVYGEPAAQTVVDRWDGWNGVFHRALAREGYLIVSFDNRGTPAPKGRAWRKVVYGSVGVLSSKEQALALEALERTHPYIDTTRIAVWGRSGGASNTLNVMFRHPEIYKVGMAVSPVPEQRLYDSIYQERYMGLPQDNAEGYKAGSSINFAEGLQGKLLLVHGSGDDNVHYQGAELLVNRLIELGKPFDFMTYPGRTHAIAEGQGTAYHLYSLLGRYLEEHVPPGPAER